MANKRTLPTEKRGEAKRMAMQPYSVAIIHDATDRGEDYFIAKNPELDGCMAYGKTPEIAFDNLREARVDYIQVCLLSGISIPPPSMHQTITSGTIILSTYDNLTYNANQVNGIFEKAHFESSNNEPQYKFEQYAPC